MNYENKNNIIKKIKNRAKANSTTNFFLVKFNNNFIFT